MATIYKNGKYYYISVSYDGKRQSKSLGTKSYEIAKKLKPFIEIDILSDLSGVKKRNAGLSFPELTDKFLKADHNWLKNTYDLIELILRSYNNGINLPSNLTSRAIYIRHINQCWNWGLKNNLVEKAYKLPGDTKGEARHRTYTKDELDMMFERIQDEKFNAFIRFAYYTGARSGEIRSITRENVLDGSIVVRGKTGRRYVKLNSQAQAILQQQDPIWSYSKDYVSHKFKKEVRRLGIKNGRFHDLRRTFGLNLIKQGMSIYKVSKLLGHKSVRTTEQHYAPLLTVDIEDFEL